MKLDVFVQPTVLIQNFFETLCSVGSGDAVFLSVTLLSSMLNPSLLLNPSVLSDPYLL